MIILWKPKRSNQPIPPVDIDANTKIYIFFDSSGSMDDTLLPLQEMRDGNLKAALIDRYNNDEALYNSMVQVIENPSERTLYMLNWLGGADHGGNVISLVFQDEATPIYYTDNYEPRTTTWNSDISALRARLNSFAYQYDGIVFQVSTLNYLHATYFKGLLLTAKSGLGTYSGTSGLSDLSDVNVVYNVEQGVSYATNPDYYLDLILGALNRTIPFTTASRISNPLVMNVSVTSSDTLTIPFAPTGFYYGRINWGDGSGWLDIDSYSGTNVTHNYSVSGTYNISITGYIRGITVNNSAFKNYLNGITSWGTVELYELNFYGCSNLTSLPSASIPDTYLLEDFNELFRSCTSLTTIPSGMFDNHILATSFNNTFRDCSNLITVPSGIFDNNTSVTSFRETFLNCTNLSSIPNGIFDNNVNVESFYGTFRSCLNLETVPIALFKYNSVARVFLNTFFDCRKLQLNKWIFFESGEEATRFAGVVPFGYNFQNCFYRFTFTGTQGEAPELWNCTYGTTVTKTGCYDGGGNSLVSLSNYFSIPIDWR